MATNKFKSFQLTAFSIKQARKKKHCKQINDNAGFTLIELMITIAIIGILASIAFPTYHHIMQKNNRQEAIRTLLEGSQMMESHYAMNFSYSGAVVNGKLSAFTTSSDFNNFYSLSASAAQSTYSLFATPINTQVTDDCGTLKITHTGATSAFKKVDSIAIDVPGCW